MLEAVSVITKDKLEELCRAFGLKIDTKLQDITLKYTECCEKLGVKTGAALREIIKAWQEKVRDEPENFENYQFTIAKNMLVRFIDIFDGNYTVPDFSAPKSPSEVITAPESELKKAEVSVVAINESGLQKSLRQAMGALSRLIVLSEYRISYPDPALMQAYFFINTQYRKALCDVNDILAYLYLNDCSNPDESKIKIFTEQTELLLLGQNDSKTIKQLRLGAIKFVRDFLVTAKANQVSFAETVLSKLSNTLKNVQEELDSIQILKRTASSTPSSPTGLGESEAYKRRSQQFGVEVGSGAATVASPKGEGGGQHRPLGRFSYNPGYVSPLVPVNGVGTAADSLPPPPASSAPPKNDAAGTVEQERKASPQDERTITLSPDPSARGDSSNEIRVDAGATESDPKLAQPTTGSPTTTAIVVQYPPRDHAPPHVPPQQARPKSPSRVSATLYGNSGTSKPAAGARGKDTDPLLGTQAGNKDGKKEDPSCCASCVMM